MKTEKKVRTKDPHPDVHTREALISCLFKGRKASNQSYFTEKVANGMALCHDTGDRTREEVARFGIISNEASGSRQVVFIRLNTKNYDMLDAVVHSANADGYKVIGIPLWNEVTPTTLMAQYSQVQKPSQEVPNG